jgi:hypothetical protein
VLDRRKLLGVSLVVWDGVERRVLRANSTAEARSE